MSVIVCRCLRWHSGAVERPRCSDRGLVWSQSISRRCRVIAQAKGQALYQCLGVFLLALRPYWSRQQWSMSRTLPRKEMRLLASRRSGACVRHPHEHGYKADARPMARRYRVPWKTNDTAMRGWACDKITSWAKGMSLYHHPLRLAYCLNKQQDMKDGMPAEAEVWCTRCRNKQPREGGTWKVVANGKFRRWVCGRCLARQKERSDD